MQVPQQLEIIHPDGEVAFYDLDPRRGVVNIGRDPDNDIVIDSPVIAPFHVVLDHRQHPCYVVKLSTEENVAIDGQATPYHTPTPLPGWTPLEIAGTTFILLEEEGEVEPHRPTAETQAAADSQASLSGLKGLWQGFGKMMPGAKKFQPPRQMDQLRKV
ncbi:MAG TPA: FHA domain-containing protein, partial [Chloroflexi bacterium]|nr:FHA domain-containing protein [Chloroflexota bacterium]